MSPDPFAMKFFRFLLAPFALVYGSIVWVRNKFYDLGFFSSKSFDIPIICVGNLSTGGTGKTPHIEYLIRLLHKQYSIAVLSRGYKRKSTGFLLADSTSTAEDIGDEPMQFHRKFPDIGLAVDTKRVHGVEQTRQRRKDTQVILLDDGFQHRALKAGYYILLTSFDQLYINDYLLPVGNLREARSGAKRADMIIVTKCPDDLSPGDQENIRKKNRAAEPPRSLFKDPVRYASGTVWYGNTRNRKAS